MRFHDRLLHHYTPFFILAVLVIGLTLTVFLAQRQQRTRSSAASVTSCPTIGTGEVIQQNKTAVQQASAALSTIKRDLLDLSGKYQTLSPERKAALRTELQSLATERKRYLLRTMRANPDKALSEVLSNDEQSAIDTTTNNCVEEQTTQTGVVEVRHVDYDTTSEDMYTLVKSNTERYQLRPAGKKKNYLASGMKITIQGYQLDNNILFDTSQPDTFTVLSESKTAQDIASSFGDQRVIGIMANFLNTPQPNFTQGSFQTTLFTDVNNYYKENSYNKTSLSGNIVGWYTLPSSQSCDIDTIMNLALNVADNDVDYTQYKRIVLFAPFGLQCGWNGGGTIGNVELTAEGQTIPITITWVNLTPYEDQKWIDRVVAHELGHNFGLHHAAFVRCGSSSFCASTTSNFDEYGDPYTIMGKGAIAHMNVPHKEYIGWLPQNQIQTVTTSESYTIEPLSTQTTGLKALKIPQNNGQYLYVEYRQPLQADSDIQTITGTDAFDGALIHTVLDVNQPATIKTILVDTSPPSDPKTPVLKIGNTFTDPVTNTRITVINKTQQQLTLDVVINGIQLPSATPTGTSITPPASPTPQLSPNISTTPVPPTSANATKLSFSLLLHGIGLGGDNANPQSIGTLLPQDLQRPITVEAFDSANQRVTTASGLIAYSPSTGVFLGTVNTGVALPADTYSLRIKVPMYLKKNISAKIVSSTQTITVPTTSLVTGDINNDNALNILDYNILIDCYSDNTPPRSCTDSKQNAADLNDDGMVNQLDYNLFLREITTQVGS